MTLMIWTLLTVGALLALFVVCVVAVVAGVRGLERVFGRRESGPAE